MQVLGIAGSLRSASYNRALLRAARELAPAGAEIVDFDLRELPFYDGDVEAAGDPEAVAAFKDAIRAADALLIATPEYNHGLPGVLKNAIDWASRPALASPLAGKPVAIMGASTGRGGTRSKIGPVIASSSGIMWLAGRSLRQRFRSKKPWLVKSLPSFEVSTSIRSFTSPWSESHQG